jgi:hypothetical protein
MNDIVFCVFFCDGEARPYDLQFIADTEADAFAFARRLMEEVVGYGWVELSTGRHWLQMHNRYVLRVSSVAKNVPRAQQPGDPETLRSEILTILSETHADSYAPN